MFKRLTATDVAEMTAVGTLDKLDLSKIPNSKNIIKTFSIADSPHFSPHIYSGNVVVYNPKLIPDTPTGMDALWDPKNRGKVGIVDIQHVYTTMSAALVAGGKPGDFDKAKKALLDLKKLQPRFYPSNEALAQALYDRRGRALRDLEGARRAMAKRRREHTDRRAQGGAPRLCVRLHNSEERTEQGRSVRVPRGRARAFGAGRLRGRHGLQPGREQREDRPGAQERIGFSAEEEKLLVNPDLEFLAKRTGELKDFWDKEFKSGA